MYASQNIMPHDSFRSHMYNVVRSEQIGVTSPS